MKRFAFVAIVITYSSASLLFETGNKLQFYAGISFGTLKARISTAPTQTNSFECCCGANGLRFSVVDNSSKHSVDPCDLSEDFCDCANSFAAATCEIKFPLYNFGGRLQVPFPIMSRPSFAQVLSAIVR